MAEVAKVTLLESVIRHLRRMRRTERRPEEQYYLTVAICETERLLPHYEIEPFDASGYTGE